MNSGQKKILFLLPSLAGGGAERVFSVLLRHLDRSSFELHLAVLQAQGPYRKDIPKDVVLHDLQVSRVRYSLPSIVKVAWKVRPQAVLSTLEHLNLALILAKPFLPSGMRLLVREAVIPSACIAEESRHPSIWIWLYRHLYKRADKVVCLSDSMVDDMVEQVKIPRQKLVRIYNPVDIMRVQELSQIGASPFLGSGPHLVAAGRLCRQKGFDILLVAMPTVREHFPQVSLSILGEGPLRADLTEQARGLGLMEAVRFPGFQENPWRFMRRADLFVLPSRYEGLPNAVLEALVLGKRVVATDCPGGIQEIQECSDLVVIVPPEDPRALAEAIVAACKAARLDQGPPQATTEALSKFSVSQIVGEYSKLLFG
jgi:glycosyltransferase involved in cell wall biosynthesis